MKVKQILFILAFLFAGTVSMITPAEAVVLMPDADGYLVDYWRDGTIDYISETSYVDILNQRVSPSFSAEEQGILEFDISGLSGPVSSAFLDLDIMYSLIPSGYPATLGFYSYAGDGAISGSDHGMGTLINLYDYNGEPNIQMDVTAPLQNLVNDNENFMGFNLRMETAPALGVTAPNVITFNSLEYPRSALLNIVESNVVPEPGTLFLIGAGLMGLVSGRKRKI